jgi:hypothetical protein
LSIVGWVSISLLVVRRAPQVLVRERRSRRPGLVEREPILLVRENVLDGAKAIGAELLGARTGRVQSVHPMDAAQAHEPQARAIALLRMRAAFEDARDEPSGGGTGLFGPPDKPRRRPSACARCDRGMWRGSVA